MRSCAAIGAVRADPGRRQLVRRSDFFVVGTERRDVNTGRKADEMMERVACAPLHMPFEVQMRPTCVTRVAHFTEHLAADNKLACHHIDGAAVGVERDAPIGMHHKYQVAVARDLIIAVRDQPFVDGANAGARVSPEVHARMLVRATSVTYASEMSPHGAAFQRPQQRARSGVGLNSSASSTDPFIARRLAQ